jgi:hypothetical protein
MIPCFAMEKKAALWEFAYPEYLSIAMMESPALKIIAMNLLIPAIIPLIILCVHQGRYAISRRDASLRQFAAI